MVNSITIQSYRQYVEDVRAADEEYQRLYPAASNDSQSIEKQRRACEFTLDKLEARLGTAQGMLDILKQDILFPKTVGFACDAWLQEAGGA